MRTGIFPFLFFLDADIYCCPGVGLDFPESVLVSLQDSADEVSDELITAGLALRNVVKLARMGDCEIEKIEEYRRLLEVCCVLDCC